MLYEIFYIGKIINRILKNILKHKRKVNARGLTLKFLLIHNVDELSKMVKPFTGFFSK